MADSQKLNQTAQQTAQCQPGQCKACERQGIPVLPLRYAPTPAIGAKYNKGIEAQFQDNNLRVLRQGYVYVLFDRKVWQAYQVTPEGALRQFDPLQPPPGPAQPLSKACISEDHDIPASFINLDSRYSVAQIAFANDPWPKKVLDDYRTGKSPATRFSTYNIAQFRTDPSKAGVAKTDEAMGLTDTQQLAKKVWEYAPGTQDFQSVHGFYSRARRLAAMQAFVKAGITKYQLKQGVPVVLLPDPIGTVQEYNSLRNLCVQERNVWASEPMRRYQYFTSQALLGLKDQEARMAAQEAASAVKAEVESRKRWNENPYLAAKAPLPSVDVKDATARETASMTKDMHGRLEEHYHENDRRKFQDGYDGTMASYQKRIDRFGKSWAQWCDSPGWPEVCEHDYDGDNVKSGSGRAYTGMMSLCLAGGPSEAPEPSDPKKDQPPPLKGPTRILWSKWLKDKNSPPYKALLAKNTNFLAGLAPSFDENSKLTLNDSSKLYEAFKTVLTSKDAGEAYMQPALQQSVGVLLMAVNSAAGSLHAHIGDGVKHAQRHLNMGVAWLYQRQHVTLVTVQLTVSEYMQLLSGQLHDAMGQAGRKVRALILGGMVSLPNAAVRNKTISIRLWALESAESVKKRLLEAQGTASQGIHDAFGRMVVGVETLEPGAIRVLKSVEVGSRTAYTFARATANNLRMAAGGKEVLLAFVSLYGQWDSLQTNMNTLKTTVGAAYTETLIGVWSASVGVFASAAELTGKSARAFADGAKVAAEQAGKTAAAGVLESAAGVAKFVGEKAGVVAAASSFVDAAQDGFMAARASKQGDAAAEHRYIGAGVLSTLAGVAGVFGAAAPEAILLGPLGLAVVLGLAAYAVVQWAKDAESTPMEMWARRCFFGDHKGASVAWTKAEDADEAIAALNAVLLGMSVDVGFEASLRPMTGTAALGDGMAFDLGHTLAYRIVLPDYKPAISAYAFALSVTRHGGRTQVLVARQENTSSLGTAQPAPKGKVDYDAATLAPAVFTKDAPQVISGAIVLNSGDEGGHDVEMASVHVKYYPDRLDEYGFAELTVQEKL
ncbi:T6SS effector BTH_I2691 family protein [Paraburkholderia diazotrophica]|uniref:T6SS effector BTH_I2691 family protein n=1 Tax=Paraburkholderia diazotrophica TaxID=667676 RepID=UPI00316BA8B1